MQIVLFLFSTLLIATAALANESAVCAGVVVSPRPSDRATPDVLRETQEVLFKRVVAAHETKKLTNSLFVSWDRDRFIVDAPGMTCFGATRLTESWIIRTTSIDIGITSEAPEFHECDLEPNVEMIDNEVRLRIRRSQRERFRALTRDNIGSLMEIRIDGSSVALPIKAEQTSGVIVLDRNKVSDESFIANTILPTQLDIVSCGRCFGEYD